MNQEERRAGYSVIAEAARDAAVAKTQVENLANNFNEFKLDSKVLHQETRMEVKSGINDLKTILKSHMVDFVKHEAADELTRMDVAEIKNKQKNQKYLFLAVIFGAILGNKGLDAAINFLKNFIGG